MKYIDAEKLKEKIQPHYENAKKRARYAAQTGTSESCVRWDEAVSTYGFILYLIDSLQQEQPEVDLEKEIEEYFSESDFYTGWNYDDVTEVARDFWNKGYNARKKE